MENINPDHITHHHNSPKHTVKLKRTTTQTHKKTHTQPDVVEDPMEPTAWMDILSGGLAGMSSIVVGQPFDTVKVRLQTNPAFTSATSVLLAASKSSEGLLTSLFKGMGPPVYTATAVNAIVFSMYGLSTRTVDRFAEELRVEEDERNCEWENRKDGNFGGKMYSSLPVNHSDGGMYNNSWKTGGAIGALAREGIVNGGKGYEFWKNFSCGCFAGLMQCVVICPTEHIKCRLQAQTLGAEGYYRSPLEATKDIYGNYGIKGVYRGWTSTCMRELPSFGLYFSCYDLLRDGLQEYVPTLPNFGGSVIAGGISGSITWALVYPVDIAKTVIQTLPMATPNAELSTRYVIKDICKKRGWRYLFRGLGVTILRAFPVNGMIFPVYEGAIYCLTTEYEEWRFKDVF